MQFSMLVRHDRSMRIGACGQWIGLTAAVITLVGGHALPAQATKSRVTIVQTSIADRACTKTASSAPDEGDFASFRCPGTAGYRLNLEYGDARENLTLVTPSGAERDLELWSRVGSAFSSLGDVVEWRLVNGKPVALTVRYLLSDIDDSQRTTSYLVVAKITATAACPTDKVPPGPNQNVKARALAATAASRPCLPLPS